jgi:RND family efflux transporter MFP subunit
MNKYLLSLLSLGFLVSCSRTDSTEQVVASKYPTAIKIAKVNAVLTEDMIDVPGIIKPEHIVTISAQLMGTVSEMSLKVGQHVHLNESLLRIQSGEVSARYNQAVTELSQAKFDLAREKGLLVKSASTADLVHNLTTRVHVLEAVVQQAKSYVNYLQPLAPFDAVVSKKYVEEGSFVAPGMPLLEIEQVGPFCFESNIPEKLVHSLKKGATYTLEVEGQFLQCALSEFSSAANVQSHEVFAKFRILKAGSLLSGGYATVKIPNSKTTKLYVPKEAVVREGQLDKVFVVGEDKHVVLRLVKVGQVVGSKTELLSGVEASEKVVLLAPVDLREGQIVEVLP